MNPDERIAAVWCVDSETGEKVLIDRLTDQVISRGEKTMDSITDSVSMSAAEEIYHQRYTQGREDAFKVAQSRIDELEADLRDALERIDYLEGNIGNFIRVGAGLFKVELPNEK